LNTFQSDLKKKKKKKKENLKEKNHQKTYIKPKTHWNVTEKKEE
jgi:hypothetical protein